jgi:thiol-disulfide isomerase/thioredoxin
LPSRGGVLTGVFVAVVAIGLVIGWIVSSTTGPAAAVGETAPDFTVTLIEGGQFDLSTHFEEDGRPIVLNLWASWCGPCRTEIPAISNWSLRNPEVLVLGVAVEDQDDDSRALAAELRPAYQLAIGSSEFRGAYPSLGLPATYIIDANGDIADLINGIVDEDSLDARFEAAISG